MLFYVWDFAQYTTGVFDEFEGSMLFVALTDNPLLRHISETWRLYWPIQYQRIYFFLVGFKPGYDVFKYVVSCAKFSVLFLVIGIDISQFCNPVFNVDFVHFVWNNFHRFNFKKYAIILLPSTAPSLPQMLCLQYYRTKSDGWEGYGNCDDCLQGNIRNVRPLSGFRQPDVCSCNICKRQLPSLAHLTNYVLLNYTLTLKRFTLTADITYQ